jgi:hypothetical protein
MKRVDLIRHIEASGLWLPLGGRQAHGLRQSDRTKSIHGSAAPRDQRIHGKENLP